MVKVYLTYLKKNKFTTKNLLIDITSIKTKSFSNM